MRELIRFGPFELDLEAAELRTDGRSLRLPEQQFQILHMLLVAEGGVVSREEIRKRLWPNDTVVEFDRSINAAIMKLRAALGDTGDEPRFVETLVRRGYRFMVPVEWAQFGPSETSVREPLTNYLIGKKVSHYRVLGILGGGGMGLVYKGEDLKLNRPVALKFLPDEMALDLHVVQRFEREARTASSLNHPNICTIYEVDEHDDQPFIVMELLEGETLRELIARFADPVSEPSRGLPIPRLLDIAAQIAEGLNAAHQNGIIHRDIKPANIFVTPSGRVKILDFGLAKAAAEAVPDLPGETAAQDSQLLSSKPENLDLTLSRTGITMGTAGYMSPEQVRGEKLDARTDLFSFGLILFEMATGRRAFSGETATIVQQAILHQPLPPVRELNPELPVALEQIIGKALEKDREVRYAKAAEMLADLTRLKQYTGLVHATAAVEAASPGTLTTSAQLAAAASARRVRLWLWLVAAVAVLVLAWFLRPTLPPPEVTGTKELTHDDGPKTSLGFMLPLTSDGSRIYFSEDNFAGSGIFEVSTDGGDVEHMTVNMGVLRDISPLRPQLLLQGWDGSLWTAAVPVGQPHRIGNLTSSDAAWSPDGKTLYFAREHSIFSAAPDGSNAHKLLTVEGDPSWMRFSPDGRVLRFTVTTKLQQGITSLWEAQADGSHLHQLLPGFTNPASDCCGSWTPDGKYFVFRATQDGTSALWTMREGGDWFHEVSHAPVRLTQAPLGAYFPLPGKDGKVYFAGVMPRGELMRYDAKTRSLSPFLKGIPASGLTFSKDGKHIVFMSYPDDELWYGKSDGTGLRQLTFPPLHGGMVPRISPDGSRIAFTAYMPGKPPQIYVIPIDGGDPEAITSSSQGSEDPIWSPSGDAVLYGPWEIDTGTNALATLQLVNLKMRAVTSIPGSSGLFSPKWSPDGRYLVAIDHNSVRLKLFDMNLHTWQDLAGEIKGGYPEWTPDSKCVVFVHQEGAPRLEYRVCLADRKVQLIAEVSASGKLVEDFGSWGWTGLAPDGSILALRDTSTQEIYALDVKWP